MSRRKKLNRNIQTLPLLSHVNIQKYPSTPTEDIFSYKGHIFDELTEKECSTKLESDPAECVSLPFKKSNLIFNEPSTFNDTDVESLNSGISEIKLIASLSTSPSWSDDNEGSKQVQDELEHMDRILRGIDPIPLHFDIDEYKQWMETFPSLSLFGEKVFGPYKIHNGLDLSSTYNNGHKREIPFLKTDEMRNLKQYKEEIKKAVIYNIYENLSTRLNSEVLYPNSACKKQKLPLASNTHRTCSYLNDCLQNSPFTCIIQDSRCRRNSSNRRYNLLEDEVEVSPRFESLPLMFEDRGKNINLSYNKVQHSLNMRKSRRSFILPPINNERLASNQVRSISATPTYSSLLSAKGIKLEKKKFNGKSRNIH
ncbi:hypothetical protein WA026_003766 [Henosepilachna vigintioctopunctata]|uniref:Uncharacterized protein n=1 Tax=Henosepilachna vigintioctopunctata TaxID=420089 RepID=A0AAW1UFM9_9CUCU